MKEKNLPLTYDAGRIHPHAVSHFEPKTKLPVPAQGSANDYGGLNDRSSYSEYAWEFLRRNRFYQAMIDQTRPAFDLVDWGYRPTSEHEAGFGLCKAKHYLKSHEDDPPHWQPIFAIKDRLQSMVKHHKRPHSASVIEYPNSQVAVTFDLAPNFGPGTVALETQVELALEYLARLVRERATLDSLAPKEPINRPNLKLLRGYLRMTDVLSNPQQIQVANAESLPVSKQRAKPAFLSAEEAATLMPQFDTSDDSRTVPSMQKRVDRVYRYIEESRKHIYGWECLTLLKFDSWATKR